MYCISSRGKYYTFKKVLYANTFKLILIKTTNEKEKNFEWDWMQEFCPVSVFLPFVGSQCGRFRFGPGQRTFDDVDSSCSANREKQ